MTIRQQFRVFGLSYYKTEYYSSHLASHLIPPYVPIVPLHNELGKLDIKRLVSQI